MAQQRTWNYGDTFTAQKAKDAQKALHKAGRYTGYEVTVFDTDTLKIASGGFLLLPNGIVVSESSDIYISFSSLPFTATTYSLTIRHTDQKVIGGAPALYAIETGELADILEDGIVIAWIDHPGGAVALDDSFIRLAESQQDSIGTPTGTAGGDLSGTYPNPSVAGIQGAAVSSTAPVDGDILRYNGTEYVPISATGAVGDGIPAAVWNLSSVASAPTNFVNGFRELGVSALLQKVILSQEVAGSAGSLIIQIYKIDEAGVETQITSTAPLAITAADGNKARIVYTEFGAGLTSLAATDRLGIKVTQTQTGALEDVTITAIVSGAALPSPPPPDSRSIVQALDAIAFGTTYVQVGSLRLVPGTLDGTDTRFMVGTTLASDSMTLEIRKTGSTIAVATLSITGTLQDYALGSDVVIFEDTFYDIFIKGNSVSTIAQLKGLKVVYEPSNRRDVQQALVSNVTGTIANLIGSIYLPAGTLQSGSSFVLGTNDIAGTATLELRRFTTGTPVGTITSTGIIQVVTPSAPIVIPYPGFYDLYLKSDSVTVTAMISGLNIVVIS